MSGLQSIASYGRPQSLQAAPEVSGAPSTPQITGVKFTIKLEDYLKTMKVFNDLAWEKVINSKVESDVYDFNDYGGGKDLYNTITRRFRPDREDGTYSAEEQSKLRAFDQEFQARLVQAGIRNYAPEW